MLFDLEMLTMRKTYHLCLSSHDEVMARSESDLDRMFNCFAEAVIQTESRALADAELTTHNHACVQTDDPKRVMFVYRNGYSRFFNSKYSRRGRLGEKDAFSVDLVGTRRIAACVSYVNRQGLHHGLTETAFGYRHCSSNTVFQKELGKSTSMNLLSERSKYKYLSSNARDYSGYRMDASGLFLREDIVDVAYVEEIYVTPRNFLYQMTRYSDDKWIAEQKDEDTLLPPVTLELIENGVTDLDIETLRRNERGRVDYNPLTDIDLCTIIDNEYVPKYLRGCDNPSIYMLTDSKRAEIGNLLWKRLNSNSAGRQFPKVTSRQLERCLVIHATK